MYQANISVAECFGLSPVRQRLREAKLALQGDSSTPKTRWDTTSARLLQPELSLPLWLGRRPAGRRIPIYNFFCRTQPPPELGWSLCVRQARDFRGLAATYDSHNGTDFAVPPGTTVVAGAAGRVLRISSEFNRGGLKVFIDHGRGLITSSNHLSRALVKVGDLVRRGQPVALSGMSGIDGFLLFPFSTPHLHYNIWHDGAYTDPFARDDEVSLWRTRNDPTPWDGSADADVYTPTVWDPAAVEQAIAACVHAGTREDIASRADPAERGMAAHFHMSYFPTRFRGSAGPDGAASGPRPPRDGARVRLYQETHPREPRLDLPFSRDDFDGVVFPSEERSRVRD